MKKRITTILVLAVLMLSVFTACGTDKPKVLTPEEAQQIALEDAGLSASQVADIHTHVVESQEVPSYSIHITVGGVEYEYIIAATTGEILFADDIS